MNLLDAQRAVFASSLGPNEKLVALALLNHWSPSRDTFPGVNRLVAWTSLSRCSVMRAVKALETAGAVVVVRASGLANRYQLGALTSLPPRPVSHSDQSPTDTPPVSPSDGTGLPERLHPSPPETRSDPVSDPPSDPHKGAREVYLTDGTRTRRVDRLAASFGKGEVERHAFATWAKAFGKTGAVYDSKRASCLAERVAAGMTKHDADDAIAGALLDDWVTGKKTGEPHNGLNVIFGTADQYEKYLERGRRAREKPKQVRKAEAARREAEYQARLKAEADAVHAAAAAAIAGGTPSGSQDRSRASLVGNIGD